MPTLGSDLRNKLERVVVEARERPRPGLGRRWRLWPSTTTSRTRT